jgi:uncharacterized protein YndB with AHSA1/START domain
VIERVFSIDIAAPIERVWQEITQTNVRCRPMFGTMLVTALKPGAPLRYQSLDGRFTFVAGEVVEVKRPARLVHTFVFPGTGEGATLVTWELEAIPTGTRVTVTHKGKGDETPMVKSANNAWPKILELFKQEIETGDVPRGTKVAHWFMGKMSFLLPAKMRTENVEAELAANPPRFA